MKSCLRCQWCRDVVKLDDETHWTCAVPLPPWRFRHGDELSSEQRFWAGLNNEEPIDGAAVAEHCAYFAQVGMGEIEP